MPLSLAAADCQREDVDHYLDRGFTPEQIVELCRQPQSMPGSSETQSHPAALQKLIDADEVVLSATALSFTQPLCVKYDEPNFAQQQKKACGLAHFEIPREGLRVVDTQTKLLIWGKNAVSVQSPGIVRRYSLGQDQLSKRDQTQLLRALPDGDKLAIPVREGVSPAELVDALQAISQTKKTAP